MKVFLKSILFISLFSGLILSCDKIDEPFPPNIEIIDSSIVWDDSIFSNSNDNVRFVLMEEFTGHTCPNCPDAAVEVERFRNVKYGAKFIPIAIHATETFAAPKDLTGAPAGSYQTDHRTDESLDYENESSFGIGKGLPRALISRRGESVTVGKWVQKCDKIYENPGPTLANIHITNFFDDSSKTFRVRIRIEWLEDYAGGMNLQIQVREDNIVDWQLDGSDHIEDYLFDHMFRGSVNGAWGSPISAASAGEITEISFTQSIENYLGRERKYSLDNYEKSDFSDWSMIAFIYKDSPEFEVMQVNEAHLTN